VHLEDQKGLSVFHFWHALQSLFKKSQSVSNLRNTIQQEIELTFSLDNETSGN